jgi:hypothetical protein
MPVLYGDVLDEAVDACRASAHPDKIKRIDRRINNDYQAIAKMASWAELRTTKTLTKADAIQLPSNMIRIDLVEDEDNGIQYMDRKHSDANEEPLVWRYYTYPVSGALATADDGAVNQDATLLTSTTLAALQDAGTDMVGEFFYVDGEDQYYEITEYSGGAFTFTPAYRGNGNKTECSVVVRPPDTKIMQLEPPTGVSGLTTEVVMHYCTAPDRLRDPQDIVRLPTSDCLVLRALSRLPEAQPHRPVSKTMVDEALREAMALNPGPPLPRTARGIHGRRIVFDGSGYQSRSGTYIAPVKETWQINRI